jgi:uncharacterized protein
VTALRDDAPQRLVVDPNVLIAALISASGAPAQLLEAARLGEILMVASPALLAELRGVLWREKFRRYVTLGEVDEYISALSALAEVRADPPADDVPQVCRDPDDDYLITLARAAGVQLLVSGDRDLLDLTLSDLVVVAPAAAVERLRAGE